MKQLRLFGPSAINLSQKLAEEKKAEIKPYSHFNGEPWC